MPKQYLDGNEEDSDDLDDFISKLDVLYVTRVQKERMEQYEEVGSYGITMDQVNSMKKESIVMHPLPRNEEIPVEIDSNHRAMYFQQMKNGLHVRMALFNLLFS
jgi:aspartate carbamoyltransferase catalytic subunit